MLNKIPRVITRKDHPRHDFVISRVVIFVPLDLKFQDLQKYEFMILSPSNILYIISVARIINFT